MVDFGQAIRDYVRFGYCTSIGNIATFGEIFGGAGSGIGEFGINAARFLHNQVCNTPAPPLPAPQFTGGQCPIRYVVSASYVATHPTLPSLTGTVSKVLQGKIQSFDVQTISGSYEFIVVHGTVANPDASVSESIGSLFNAAANGYNKPTLTSKTVVPEGGAPDTCGNPPPVIPPYTPGSNSTTNNITYTSNDGTDITVPVVIAFGYAKVDANLNLNIPFTLKLNVTPTVQITGNFNLNTGDVNYSAGNPSLPGSDCSPTSGDFVPDPNLPTRPIDIPPDVPEPPPNPDKPQYRKQIRGAIVTVTSITDEVTTLYQTDNPDVFIPDLGLISFQISVNGKSAWTEDMRVKNKRQFFTCPWIGGAVDVRGTPRPGVQFTVTPVYVKVTDLTTFPD